MINSRWTHGLGWRRDLPDSRDLMFFASPSQVALPRTVNLVEKCPPVYDQGTTNSCTGNAVAAALHFDKLRQNMEPLPPSRLFLYYNGRVPEGATAYDMGASIRDVIKGSVKWGYPHEVAWPFDYSRINDAPPVPVYAEALPHAVKEYASVPQLPYSIKSALASGIPVVCGIAVYQSMQSDAVAHSGHVPTPKRTERMMGGHAILLVGYDDKTSLYLFRNSWGVDWGLLGYGTLPYEYVHNRNRAADFWIIRSVR